MYVNYNISAYFYFNRSTIPTYVPLTHIRSFYLDNVSTYSDCMHICYASILHFVYVAWDLLRIDVYGFIIFAKWFLQTYPTHFISPLQVSGSSVESFFSQYKYSVGGKLDVVNYSTSRCFHLVKQCTTSHQTGKEYRDQSIERLRVMSFAMKP